MLVDDNIRKCVGFVGYKMADDTFRFAGSVFFLGREDQPNVIFAITAKHIVDNIRNKGLGEVYLRLNKRIGGVQGSVQWCSTPIENWFFHPTDNSVDVAVLRVVITDQFDHLVYPYSRCISDQLMRENEVGLGDEVFVVGLFRHYGGNKKNIPIIRIGNIASFGEEKVATRLGELDAYLIEARSIGGLSGSPVFLNLGMVRVIQGQQRFARQGSMHFLFGLMHGHYDSREAEVDDAEADGANLSVGQINTGIGIVVPFHKIDEVVRPFNPDLVAPRFLA